MRLIAEVLATTNGDVQLLPCRTQWHDIASGNREHAQIAGPVGGELAEVLPAVGAEQWSGIDQLCAPAARVETRSTQLDVVQVREPQTALKLSHATAIDPSGATRLLARLR